MEAIRIHKVIERNGEIIVRGLPCKKGQHVEMVLWIEPSTIPRHRLSASQLFRSGLIGLWKDRRDIVDSASYARQLREQAQRRWE